MSCAPFDLRDYFFDELDQDGRRAVETHVSACDPCRDELNALLLTRSLLRSVPDEEPPRRIAFVSDKVFEPSWWRRIWHSSSQLGFASACVLALAIGAHGFFTGHLAPNSSASPTASAAVVDSARIDAEVQKRLAPAVDQAVRQAVSRLEQQQEAKLVQAFETRMDRIEKRHQSDLTAVNSFWSDRIQKERALSQRNAFYRTSAAEDFR